MRASKRARLVVSMATAVAISTRVSAHRLDEFLQAARIGVERDRVQLEMNLTPGTAVADAVIGQIDPDGNGVLSEQEQDAYAGRVLRDLTLRVDDGTALQLSLAGCRFPDVATLGAGDGTIIIRAAARVPHLPVGSHRLFFHNAHDASDSVYLANALVPEEDDVAVTGQQRTGDQSELTIDFTVRAPSASRGQWTWVALAGMFVLAASLTWRRRSSGRSDSAVTSADSVASAGWKTTRFRTGGPDKVRPTPGSAHFSKCRADLVRSAQATTSDAYSTAAGTSTRPGTSDDRKLNAITAARRASTALP